MKKKTMEQLARLSCEDYQQVDKLPVAVILDDVRSLNNIGSMFRTADAFLIEKIYLLYNCINNNHKLAHIFCVLQLVCLYLI